MKVASDNRSFNRGSWWLLVSLGLFIILVLANTIGLLRQPGDGWQLDYNQRDQGNHLLVHFMGDWSTPLQIGDVVTAVDGQPLSSAVQMTPSTPDVEWQAGETVQYTIQRQGGTLHVPVTLHRLDVTGILRGLANTMAEDLPQWGWVVVGLVLFFLRPNNRAARLFLVASTSFAVVAKFGLAATTISLDFAPPLSWLFNWISSFFWGWLFFPSLILLLLGFPIPQWPLNRYPRLVPGLIYGIPLAVTAYTLLTGLAGLATTLLFVEAALIFGTAVAAIFRVFRNKQDSVVRAQVSWLALGIALSIGGTLIAYLLEYTGVVKTSAPLLAIVSWPVTLALPICLAVAILRYRLFDIDIIIRKTLVYAILSGLLALVYFGSVVLFQSMVGGATNEQSPLVIVVSTLIIAALFSPMRRRVQGFIDRRFYRRKVDAQRALEEFAQTARDEVSLEALTAELSRVVQETMQPEQLSLWLPAGKTDKK
jgi:hypothetical protein